MTRPAALARRLAMLTCRAGLRPAQLARIAGLSPNHPQRILDGTTRNPSPEHIVALARALGVEPGGLVHGDAPGLDLESEPCALSELSETLPEAARGAFDWRRAEAHLAAARMLEPVPLIGARAGDLALIRRRPVPVAGDLIAIDRPPGLIGFRLMSPPLLFSLTRGGQPWSEVMSDANRPIGVLAGIYRGLPNRDQCFP